VNAWIYERLTHASREAAALSTAEGPAWLEAFTRFAGTPAPSNPTPVLAEEELIRVVPAPVQALAPEEATPSTSAWGRPVLPGRRIERRCTYCHFEGHLDEDCPAPHTSCTTTACIVGSCHHNYVTHRPRCAQFNHELLQVVLGFHSKPPPTRPPTEVQLEHEEVAPHQSTAPPPYSRPPRTATSPEGGQGQSRGGR
jgi:hypothetical protein